MRLFSLISSIFSEHEDEGEVRFSSSFINGKDQDRGKDHFTIFRLLGQ